ncbi:hypothetical protein OSB04_006707 [Centaurea solstitialis]|uniref:Retrovirus-related Pol polyprotein from transposon TNT 1-94-like beta-barrel domain-containing protein n=1 Tax=Centaurea solstitialis TaxID=347529 RepID=A0AA38WHR1_9ASTR|nr:hypothetical protein OSB04_006707 [Centaurea solstitialis]
MADLSERFKSQGADFDSQKEAFKRLDDISKLDNIDPWAGCTNRVTLISEIRSTKPKLNLDPNIEYDVSVFLQPGDDPSGFVPRKPKSVLSKLKSSTESHASGFEKNKPEGAKSAGGKSTSENPSSNSHHAFNANRRRNDGGRNVKPPGSAHQRKNNRFTAFPKRHGLSHAGSGRAPPSVGFYSNMSVNSNQNLNNYFDTFRNDMCSMFDNFLRNGVANSFNAYNSNADSRKRKGKSNSSSLVKYPAPKEKSKKGTTPKAQLLLTPRHMPGHKSFLFDYVERFKGYIKTTDKTWKMIKGYGSITNGKYIIKNVWYVKGLGYNMFSSSKFYDNGYWVKRFLYGSTVNDEDRNMVLTAKRTGHLYTSILRPIPQADSQSEALTQSINAICLLTKASK